MPFLPAPFLESVSPYAVHIALSILVICHRYILGLLLTALLRFVLAVGLITFKVKSNSIKSTATDESSTIASEQNGHATHSRIEQEDFDVRVYFLGMLLGRGVGKNGSLCCLRNDIVAKICVGDDVLLSPAVVTPTENVAQDQMSSSANGSGEKLPPSQGDSYLARAMTSVHVTRCKVGSVGLVLPSVASYADNCSSSSRGGGRSAAGRALLGISFGNMQFGARVHARLEDELSNSVQNDAPSMKGEQRHSMTLNIALRLECISFGLLSTSILSSKSPRGVKRSDATPFDKASGIISRVLPAFSLSNCNVTTCLKVADLDPIDSSFCVDSFSIRGTSAVIGDPKDNSYSDDMGAQDCGVVVDLNGINIEVEDKNNSSDSVSAEFTSLCLVLISNESGALLVKQCPDDTSMSSAGEAISKIRSSIDVPSLSAIVSAANEAKIIAAAMTGLQKLKPRPHRGPKSAKPKRKRESKTSLLVDKALLGVGLDVCVCDGDSLKSREANDIVISTEIKVECAVLDGTFHNSLAKPAHLVRASTSDFVVGYKSNRLMEFNKSEAFRISNAVASHILGESVEKENNNTIEVIMNSCDVNVNDDLICQLARINRIVKTKSEAKSPCIRALAAKKNNKKKNKSNAPRVKLSCKQGRAFIEGCATDDNSELNTSRFSIATSNVGLSFTPKGTSADAERDLVEVSAPEFDVSFSINPHLLLPLHPDIDALVNREPDDVIVDRLKEAQKRRMCSALSQRPVVFTMTATNASIRALMGQSMPQRTESDRIRAIDGDVAFPPHEEIEVYAESMIVQESFGDSNADAAAEQVASSVDHPTTYSRTRLIDATEVTVSVKATKYEAGPNYPVRLLRDVRIETRGPTVQGTWSPILQQYVGMIEIYIFKGLVKRYQTMFRTKPKTGVTVDIVNVALRLPKSVLDVRVHLGHKSVLDFTAKSFVVDVINEPRFWWKKPTIRLLGKDLSGHLNDFEQQIFSLEELRFEDVLRHASADELSMYNEKIGNAPHGEKNAVVSDTNGIPIMNEIGLHLGGVLRVTVPPVLHLGEVIDDVSNNTKTMFMALRQASLQKPSSPRRYQLMKISASMPFVDASLLEPNVPGVTGCGLTSAESFDMMRMRIENLVLSVERLTPPSCTQARLNILDEDKRRQYDYGPAIQGGETSLSIRHALCILHPLTLATPLVALDNVTYTGLFMMAGINPDTPGLVKRAPYGFHFGCHHKSVEELASPDALSSFSPCGCKYGVTLTSSSAQPKMFFDGTITCNSLDGAYGMIVLDSIPLLMDIIKRLQPPSSPTSAPAGPIGWWDNLRYQIHGNMKLRVQDLCFRFLLDTPSKYDWSIVLQCREYLLDHATGGMDLAMADATLTVPGLPYHLTFKEQSNHIANDLSAACGLDSKGGHHSLLLVPRLEAKLSFDWIVQCPEKAQSTDHHSPYLSGPLQTSLSDEDAAAIAKDKFYRFRSHGVNLGVTLNLESTTNFNAWLALRIDVLPWLTHKLLSALPPPSESSSGGPGPLPIVERLSVEANAKDIHMACWFNEESDDKTTETSDRNGGVCLLVPGVKVQASNTGNSHIGIQGKIQTALLDIDYSSCYDSSTQRISEFSSFDDGMEEEEEMMMECDIAVGGFIATNVVEACNVGNTDDPRLQLDKISEGASKSSNAKREKLEETGNSAHAIFYHLQEWSKNITDLDSIVLIDSIDILLSTPLAELMLSAIHEGHSTQPDTPRSKKGQVALWHENQKPWTVLVGGLKILWTLDIRDALLSLSQDLMFTLDYMKLSLRETMASRTKGNSTTREGNTASANAGTTNRHDIYRITPPCDDEDDDHASYLDDDADVGQDLMEKSSLGYLLEEQGPTSPRIGSPFFEKSSLSRATSIQEARRMASGATPIEAKVAQNATMPTLDVHLSNPQIQLHSEQTGGSVILAMRGAYIDGKRYLNLVDPDNGLTSSSLESLLQKTELQYTLEKMEIYAITPGIEAKAGLHWLDFCEIDGSEHYDSDEDLFDDDLPSFLPSVSMQSGVPMEQSSARLLTRRQFIDQFARYDPRDFHVSPMMQLIMNRCTFDSRQIFHRHPHHLSSEEIATYVRRGRLEPLLEAARDQVDLHIDEMSFMLNAHQYITTFDLIRNVLLEPPKVSEKRDKRLLSNPETLSPKPTDIPAVTFEETPREDTDVEEKVESIVNEWNKRFPGSRDGASRQRKRIREQLRAASQEIMNPLEQQHLLSRSNLNRRIKYTLGKLKWQIQSPQYLDEVEIDFTGFRGQHDFINDGAVISNISLEDVQVTTASPGPDALAFYDPFIILACEVQGDNPCTRCGEPFNRATNGARSCVHHAGRYVYGAEGIRYWTCCGSRLQKAPGCVARPHSGREKAAVIRIETLPSPVKGFRMYKHVEINFYPNVQHKFIVQITKNLSNLLMTYFLGTDQNQGLDEDLDKDSDDESSDTSSLMHSQSDVVDDPSATAFPAEVDTSQQSASKKSSSRRSDQKGSSRRGEGKKRRPPKQEGVLTTSAVVSAPAPAASESPRPPQEIGFIKFWRIGHIHASISVAGFAIETNDLGILIPAFSKNYKVGRSNYLGQKYVSHLIHEVVKSAATSGMQKMKRKFKKSRHSKSTVIDEERATGSAAFDSTALRHRRGTTSLEAARADLLHGGSSGKAALTRQSGRKRLYTT